MSKRPRVLVLDDDIGSAVLQTRSLERAGNEVITAHNPEGAFRLLEKFPVDLIAVDYRLTGEMTGLGFCARLHAAGSRVPIILVSGSTDDRTIIQALRFGIVDFIPKDDHFLQRLPGAVANVLGRADLQVQLASGQEGSAADHKASVVLLLEDDMAAARQQAYELNQAGYVVQIAKTPEEAFRAVQRHPIGMLVLDQRLPGKLSGLDVYDELRRSGHHVPAILVTGFSDTATAANALRAGIRDYVEKTPGYTSELPKVVQRVFDRIHLERQAAESNARLAAIVSSATDAIITVELNGLITLFNQAAERTFGCDAASALGTSVTRFLPDLFASPRDGTLSPQQESRCETRGLRNDGTTVPLEVSLSKTEISARSFYTVIARDVTERKRAESALLRANEELRRVNSDLEQFAYSTSHDFREPLRNIAIYAQMLERHVKAQEGSDVQLFVSRIVDGTNRMQRLLSDLLTYTQVLKLGQGVTAEQLLVDSGAVLRCVVADLSNLLKENESIVTSDDLPRISILEVHLSQLFQNLIGNAIKYRGNEPSRVHISAVRQQDDWLFSVRDNGIGIEPQFQQTIFGLFKRLHSHDQHPGSGIGLALCKRIVERYGGRIWVESQPGAGSTFFFTLPGTDQSTAGTDNFGIDLDTRSR
jgi:PAS domain S-box-containing protein